MLNAEEPSRLFPVNHSHCSGRASLVCCAVAAALIQVPQQAQASEGGSSFYILGMGGPGTAVMPPLPGVFIDSTTYYYNGSANARREFELGGNIVAGLHARAIADFATALWVPSTDFGGGTVALGLTAPIGHVTTDVDAILTGPRGLPISLSVSDATFTMGDPVASASLGWTLGNLHVQAGIQVNVPVGHYRKEQLANLSLHRWATDTSLATSWHDERTGWDASSKVGVTFNGKNDVTNYKTGTEFHAEGAIEKIFGPQLSAGILMGYLHQISADSGAGATLGAFKGSVAIFGATSAINFPIGKSPVTLRLKLLKEFDVTNRLEGTTGLVSLSFPIHMNMPAAAAE